MLTLDFYITRASKILVTVRVFVIVQSLRIGVASHNEISCDGFCGEFFSNLVRIPTISEYNIVIFAEVISRYVQKNPRRF
jgi:hypothetical protein